MALVETMTFLDDLVFNNRQPNPDSLRLAQAALCYLNQLPSRPALGVCLCSSVAWGIATPVSDVDVGVIVPSGDILRSEKVTFDGYYIDYCEWPWNWIEDVLREPLTNPILSYMVAFGLVLYDRDGRFSETRQTLQKTLTQDISIREWTGHYLKAAERIQRESSNVLKEKRYADVFPYLFESVRRVADAILHHAAGGHCGDWPYRLREYASHHSREWIIKDAMQIIAPLGVNLEALKTVVDTLSRLHSVSAQPPCGSSMGCSDVHGEFLTRKARYYIQEKDALSLLQVIRKQIDYISENLVAKEGQPLLEQHVQALREEQQKTTELLRQAVPHTPTAYLTSVDMLHEYIVRTTSLLFDAHVEE